MGSNSIMFKVFTCSQSSFLKNSITNNYNFKIIKNITLLKSSYEIVYSCHVLHLATELNEAFVPLQVFDSSPYGTVNILK